jgi:hypothetical protein
MSESEKGMKQKREIRNLPTTAFTEMDLLSHSING